MRKRGRSHSQTSQLRIIGGQWRGRKLDFLPQPGLRPTGDRIRETLFNWLAADIHGARCVDLFAGSGALGLEALSRGAGHCDFVDTSSTALEAISKHLQCLHASENGQCHSATAERYLLTREPGALHIAFVDPPFDSDLAAPACALLAQRKLLVPGGLVYLECRRNQDIELPQQWLEHRHKQAGEVDYRLLIAP